MKRAMSVILAMALTLTAPIQAFADAVPVLSPVEKSMVNLVDKNKAEIFNISKQIYGFKETYGKEFKSSALLAEALKKRGFKVQMGVTGKDAISGNPIEFPTAFIATYEGKAGGPTIAILAEYDALPNGHSCGHNLIAESAYTAGIALQEALKTTAGKVVVYGCPSEEMGGSKGQMVAAGLFDSVDAAFIVHGSTIWSAELNVKALTGPSPWKNGLVFKGKASHASAAPEQGRSALDAAMLTGIALEFAREHMMETDRIHYVFKDGGKASNVVPDSSQTELTIRANTTAELFSLMKRVDKIIQGAALMTETTAVYEWASPLLNATPVPELWRFVAKTAASVGIKEEQFVTNIPAGASTDAGNVGYVLPTSNIFFPVADKTQPAYHTNEFAAAAGTDYAMNNSLTAGKIMALTAYRLMTQPEVLKNVKADFAQHKQ